jgi:divalent metal cation (Fe/Co/Zn/Cd) transporter
MSAKELVVDFLEAIGITGTGLLTAKVIVMAIIPEIVHGVLTLIFAIASCVAVFFVNRYLKKKYP